MPSSNDPANLFVASFIGSPPMNFIPLRLQRREGRLLAQGWLGTANQRTAAYGYGMQLSNSWLSPERSERLAQGQGLRSVR